MRRMANTPRVAPAIRGPAAKRPMPEGRRFQAGQSGNPSGRPKGIAKAVRDHIREPERLVAVLLEIVEDPRAKTSDRIMAVRELLDRGYGKAPTFATIEGHDPLELDEVSAQIQAIADELGIRRTRNQAA